MSEQSVNEPEALPTEPAPRPRVNILLLLGLLIGPAVLALLRGLTKVDLIAVASPLVGAGIGGPVCGVMIGRRFGRTMLPKIALGICCTMLFGCLSLGIGFFGCALGGFKLDLK